MVMFPRHNGHWLGKKMIPSLVGDFFETLTREVAKAKIIANNNGDTATYGSVDLVKDVIKGKLLIEVKASADSRSDYTFLASQLRDYHKFHKAGFNMEYYLWEYEKPRNYKLSSHRTEESLFIYLASATRQLTILTHDEIWPMFPESQISEIWFQERDFIALRKRILRPQIVFKDIQRLKVNGFSMEYRLNGIKDIH